MLLLFIVWHWLLINYEELFSAPHCLTKVFGASWKLIFIASTVPRQWFRKLRFSLILLLDTTVATMIEDRRVFASNRLFIYPANGKEDQSSVSFSFFFALSVSVAVKNDCASTKWYCTSETFSDIQALLFCSCTRFMTYKSIVILKHSKLETSANFQQNYINLSRIMIFIFQRRLIRKKSPKIRFHDSPIPISNLHINETHFSTLSY